MTPRYDLPMSEQGLIGYLLIYPGRVGEVASEVGAEDFGDPRMAMIYRAMLTLWERGIEPGVMILVDHLKGLGQYEQIGGARGLVELQADVASYHVRSFILTIQAESLRRRITYAARQAREWSEDVDIDPAEVLAMSRDLFAEIDVRTSQADETVPVGEFVRGEDSYDWLVPWLIERGDRMLVVAGESGGKSMLLRQLGVCCSFGIHPFRGKAVDPMRVVLLDLENPVALVRRKVRPMVAKARELRPFGDDMMLRVLCRPGGIDLSKPTDVRWLSGQLAVTRPDMVIAGPLYKMFHSDDRWESAARTVAAVFDDLRTRMNFALVLETHAPQESAGKRSLRPIGSSLWLRWPEFVLSFSPHPRHPHTVRLSVLKGRDERQVPEFLERGGAWPWTPCRDPEGPKGRPDPDENGRGLRPGFGQESF